MRPAFLPCANMSLEVMSIVYISHSVSPWELAQVYVLAREAERQGLEPCIPDRTWAPELGVPERLLGIIGRAEVLVLFATLTGNHLSWVNEELGAAHEKPIVSLVERGIYPAGIDADDIVEFDRSEDVAVAVGKASDKLAALKLQQRNKNLVTGLLVGSLALLLLRSLSQDQD